ncbi:LysR family transcriptional regulator [Actinomycetospora flava]|uniref:LysR family transcriptional regulator n=1 Tax=Actinomycetospora flava TaxID=3129232 RepID=A0ABU8MHG9_9PSEU
MSGDVLMRQLEYLVALAREEHFGRAALACHASQPALSTGLHKLERELGVTLIHHGRRFAGFTEEGRRVLGWAHRILAERDGLHDDLARMHGGLDATLRLGAIPTAMPMVGRLTGHFCARHPRARVRIEELPSTEIVRRLGDYTLDAGLTYLDPEPPSGTRSVELYRERYLLLTPEGLAPDGDEVGWAEAVDRPLCALVRLMRNRRILEAGALAAGARLDPVIEANSVAALYSHAAQGWSTVVAHTWLDSFGVPPGMRAVPLPPVPTPPVGVLTAADEPLSLVAAALLEGLDDFGVPSAPPSPPEGGRR